MQKPLISRVWKMTTAITVALMLISLTACVYSIESLTVPLEYHPTSRVATARFAGAIPATSKVFIAPVVDTRAEPNVLGANRENTKQIPILAGSSAAEFFRNAVNNEFNAAGVTVVDNAAAATHTLKFEIVRFMAEESPGYRSEIVTRAKLVDAKGATRWEGNINGFGSRFGRSLSVENYNEVISDSVIVLVEGILSNASFQAALK